MKTLSDRLIQLTLMGMASVALALPAQAQGRSRDVPPGIARNGNCPPGLAKQNRCGGYDNRRNDNRRDDNWCRDNNYDRRCDGAINRRNDGDRDDRDRVVNQRDNRGYDMGQPVYDSRGRLIGYLGRDGRVYDRNGRLARVGTVYDRGGRVVRTGTIQDRNGRETIQSTTRELIRRAQEINGRRP